jgi:solute carrier family 25 (mitochondrial aspartate/glutamate transporter), member 12/13
VKQFLTAHVGTNFNFDCDLIKRFFGTDGKKRVRVDDFSLFFNKLQNEMAQQAFFQIDPNGTGWVSLDSFFKLISNFGRRQLPESLVARIGATRHDAVSFTDFLAFQTILNNLPSLCTTIAMASEFKAGPLSKDDFKVASRVLNRRFSRAESDIVFELFDLNGDGFISPDDCKRVLGAAYIKELKAIIGRGGAITFAPPPGYTQEKRSHKHGPSFEDPPAQQAAKGIQERLLNFLEHFLLGAVAGGIGAFAVYPLDLVKTRMQNQRSGAWERGGPGRGGVAWAHCVDGRAFHGSIPLINPPPPPPI